MSTPTTFSVLDRVHAARELFPGNDELALQYVKDNAIEDVMWLLEKSRVQARYDHTRFPRLPKFFERERRGGADQVWEGRNAWKNEKVPAGTLIRHLDTPGSYLNALTCHLPIGTLEETGPAPYDKKRAGIYLVTLPTKDAWDAAHPDLPPPFGNRKKKGDAWITRPTLQLLYDCVRWGLLEWDGAILDSWTAASSEGLLKPLRGWLADARMDAINSGDKLAEEGVKTLYSRLVSTMGDSRANFEMRRTDWRHSIQAQAFSNLWRRAYKLRQAGLTLYSVNETDAIHIVDGEWRHPVTPWKEGRALGQMTLKDTYTLGKE